MTRKLLAAFLALCMTMTLTPFAFAATTTDQGETGTNTNGTDINAGGGYSKFDIAGNSNDDPPGGVSVFSGENVAEVNSTEYPTLEAAISAITTSGTVKLLMDATVAGKQLLIDTDKNITIDLNGNALKISNYTPRAPQISVKGVLTIQDNSEAKTGKIFSDYSGTAGNIIRVENNGKLYIQGGTITTEGMASSGNAIKIEVGAEAEMTGGTVKCDAKRGNASVNVAGTNKGSGKFTITGGTILAESGDNTETNITALKCTTENVFVSDNAVIKGPEAVYSRAYVIHITGGAFIGAVNAKAGSVTGGTFDTNVTACCPADKMAVWDSEANNYVIKTMPTSINAEFITTTTNVATVGAYSLSTSAVKASDRSTVKTIADSFSTDISLTNLVGQISETDKTTAIRKLLEKNQIAVNEDGTISLPHGSGTTKIILEQRTYLRAYVSNADIAEKKLSVVLTPKCTLIAKTDADNAEEVQISETNLDVSGNGTISVVLPNDFVDSNGKVAISRTKADKSVEYLNATLASSGNTVSFAVDATGGFGTMIVAAPVASVDSNVYPSLVSAIEAAKDTDKVITLLRDVTEIGVASNYSFTVDLNNHTLNMAKPLVGSTGTETNGFQLKLKPDGTTPDVTLKNGTIRTEKAYILIQNYSNLTLENMVLDGRKIPTTKADDTRYTLSNNNGNTIIKDSVIYAPETKGIAFDSCRFGGYPSVSVTVQGNSIINGNVEVTSSTSTGPNPKLIVENGKFNGSVVVTGGESADISISGGYFTEKPNTAYVVSGREALYGSYVFDGVTYAYKVDAPLPTNVEVAAGKTEATAPESVEKAVVESVSKTTVTGVTEEANEVANKLSENDKATKDSFNVAASAANSLIPTVDDKAITTIVAPRLDITITDYDSASKTLTLDIEAVYDIKATTNPDSMVELEGDNATQVNTVTIKENAGKLDTTGTPVVIKLALPTDFAAQGDTLYITHTKSTGAKYVYPVTVQEDSAGNLYVEFTNDKGFSTFNVNKVVGASITTNGNTTYYETLQDAVDAVQNGETIEILKDGETATVSGRSVNFTVAPADKTYTINLGSNCKNNATEANEYDIVYSRPSSGSGSSVTTYNVNVTTATNGTVTADKKTAAKGATVTVTATPSAGYVVESVKVVDKDGKTVDVTAKDGKYSFVMPASAVTVTATFKAEAPAPSGLPFTDVKEGDWFYGAVKYAYENGLMNGTGETIFAPNGTMNRAMIVTVLYRLEKSPAVTTASQFKDVPAGQWYSDAVAWAAANNIVNGYDETTFGPMNAVTREQMAAILFRYEQYKGMDTVTLEDNLAKFPDKDKISGYAVPALNWAVGQKVINGNADGTLDPTGTATRAQVAQILTNLLNK